MNKPSTTQDAEMKILKEAVYALSTLLTFYRVGMRRQPPERVFTAIDNAKKFYGVTNLSKPLNKE